jgi:hypothetical protein
MGGYMVCDECGKHYNLQPGELPEDYKDKYNCGGNFKFKMSLNNLEEYDTSPKKYEVNKYVQMTHEDEQFCKERKLKPIYRINFKKNFSWFHILF